MTTVPSTVSPGQVITAAQSNTYRTAIVELQADRVKDTGDTMTGPLLLPTTQSTNANAAIHKTYADTHYVAVAGDTMTGPLILPTTQSANGLTAIHRTYADTRYVLSAGDTMTGLLTINGAGDEGLRIRGATGHVTFFNEAGTARQGYVQATSTEFKLAGEAAVMSFLTDVSGLSERMRLSGAALLIGKIADELTSSGVTIYAGGSASEGSVRSVTAASGALTNFYGKHIGSADADGQLFLLLQNSGGTSIGSISQGPGANTVFNAGAGGSHPTTSDYRLKEDLGPITDPVARVRQLVPKHLGWKPASGMYGEFDNFIAHEVQSVVPAAVTGDKDAVYPADSPIDPGGIKAQGLDNSKLVPLLTAALQTALDTIDDLTARVSALEAA